MATRELILDAAAKQFFEHGYAESSLQKIAESVELRQSNLYYYFKTKHLLGLAVLDLWLQTTKGGLALLDKHPPGKQRLLAYIKWSNEQREIYYTHGCPIAKLSSELRQEASAEREELIESPYVSILDWLTEQFLSCGFELREAKARGKFMLSLSQGTIHVGHVLADKTVFTAMHRLVSEWLDTE
ncbi:MAG: TetR/AcrR family transcriptional regulator [Aureliella sp.]